MKTVIKVLQLHEADMIKAKLETHGIKALIPDQSMASTFPVLGSTRGGIRVQVADEDYERARELLEETDA